jgi:hypothetical protein
MTDQQEQSNTDNSKVQTQAQEANGMDKDDKSNQVDKNNKADTYDDELDENFETELSKHATEKQLENTLESFENPKGIEDSNDASMPNGLQMDPKEIEKLQKKLMNMPRDKLMSVIRNISQKTDLNLGNNDFRSVNGDHREDAKKRLRQKLEQKRLARKPKDLK